MLRSELFQGVASLGKFLERCEAYSLPSALVRSDAAMSGKVKCGKL